MKIPASTVKSILQRGEKVRESSSSPTSVTTTTTTTAASIADNTTTSLTTAWKVTKKTAKPDGKVAIHTLGHDRDDRGKYKATGKTDEDAAAAARTAAAAASTAATPRNLDSFKVFNPEMCAILDNVYCSSLDPTYTVKKKGMQGTIMTALPSGSAIGRPNQDPLAPVQRKREAGTHVPSSRGPARGNKGPHKSSPSRSTVDGNKTNRHDNQYKANGSISLSTPRSNNRYRSRSNKTCDDGHPPVISPGECTTKTGTTSSTTPCSSSGTRGDQSPSSSSSSSLSSLTFLSSPVIPEVLFVTGAMLIGDANNNIPTISITSSCGSGSASGSAPPSFSSLSSSSHHSTNSTKRKKSTSTTTTRHKNQLPGGSGLDGSFSSTSLHDNYDNHSRDDDDTSVKSGCSRASNNNRKKKKKKKMSSDSQDTATTTADTTTSAPQKRIRKKTPENKEYFKPTDKDVLCGRGGETNKHPGNIKFRAYARALQPKYKDDLKREEKTRMSESLVEWVQTECGGKFLQSEIVKDEENGGTETKLWFEVLFETARDKASQILREDHSEEGKRKKKGRQTKKAPPPKKNTTTTTTTKKKKKKKSASKLVTKSKLKTATAVEK